MEEKADTTVAARADWHQPTPLSETNRQYFTINLIWSLILSRLRYLSKQRSNLKGQITSKANCQDMNSSKKWTYEFVFTTMRCVFLCFLEEIEDSKKSFRNYLIFSKEEKVDKIVAQMKILWNIHVEFYKWASQSKPSPLNTFPSSNNQIWA